MDATDFNYMAHDIYDNDFIAGIEEELENDIETQVNIDLQADGGQNNVRVINEADNEPVDEVILILESSIDIPDRNCCQSKELGVFTDVIYIYI